MVADDSCRYCYAPLDAATLQTARDVELYRGTTEWRNGRYTWTGLLTELRPDHPAWTNILKWPGVPRPLLGEGKPSLVWQNSMADVFVGRRVELARRREVVDRIFETVTLTRHINLVLTKYPEQMVEYFRTKPAWWRRKIWLGFSAGDQRWWDVRWKIMRPLAEQGWTIFTSIQPMLGPVMPPPDFFHLGKWLIVGGEQAPGHREMKPVWARALLDQCLPTGVPVFVKQKTRGRLEPDLLFRQFPQV